jgi:hypothetical protein
MTTNADTRNDYEEHQRTCRGFLKGTAIIVAHVLVILLLMGWYFSDAFV